MHKRFCTICGISFDANLPSDIACCVEHEQRYSSEIMHWASNYMQSKVPECLEVLGHSSIEEFQKDKELLKKDIVYFIKEPLSGKIKIGHTTRSVNQRLQQLQTSFPEKLELLGYFEGTIDDEKRLHAKFENHRMSGEWFRPANEVVEYIDKVTSNTGVYRYAE